MRGRWFHMSVYIPGNLLFGRSGKNEMCGEKNGEARIFKTDASDTFFWSPDTKAK
jgi:hypothetical protein